MVNDSYEALRQSFPDTEKERSYWELLNLASRQQHELLDLQHELDRFRGTLTGEDLTYSAALLQLRSGAQLSRRQWGATKKPPHVRLIQPEDYILLPKYVHGVLLPATLQHQCWFVVSAPDGTYGPWQPTTEDQLATDWYTA